jgi:4a-hydroxytetrahydrobiopterin dehydratase
MSEQGWREFLHADGVDDWVVLHGGAVAVFRVGSVSEGTELAEAIAQVPGLEGSGALMTLGADHLTVRLTRGMVQLEPMHVGLAHAVSAVTRSRGVVADRGAAHEVQLAIAARPGSIDVVFWRAVLGYDPRAEDNAIDPLGHGSTVWMQELDPSKELRHAMHVDVSVAREHIDAPRGRPRRGGSDRGRLRGTRELDRGGSCRQQGLHRRLARRRFAVRPLRIGVRHAPADDRPAPGRRGAVSPNRCGNSRAARSRALRTRRSGGGPPGT